LTSRQALFGCAVISNVQGVPFLFRQPLQQALKQTFSASSRRALLSTLFKPLCLLPTFFFYLNFSMASMTGF